MLGNGENLTLLIFLMITIGYVMLVIYAPKIIPRKWPKWITKKTTKVTDYNSLNKLLETVGYSYDIVQDLFYSNLDAWQREMGYCRLYDEAAAPLSMIIDCEPIYFEYDHKRWLIEFWKGQYGMTTGCEIGVYVSDMPDLNTDLFKGTFYNCVSDNDLLNMSFALRKNGLLLMKRKAAHWWLTGFKLGEFSETRELTADINITLKNRIMRNEFIKGLMNAGYLEQEIIVRENSVCLKFDKPKSKQPFTRTKFMDEITQMKNKLLCDQYESITKEYDNLLDKVLAVQRVDPGLIQDLFRIGKTKQLFSNYNKLKKYL